MAEFGLRWSDIEFVIKGPDYNECSTCNRSNPYGCRCRVLSGWIIVFQLGPFVETLYARWTDNDTEAL